MTGWWHHHLGRTEEKCLRKRRWSWGPVHTNRVAASRPAATWPVEPWPSRLLPVRSNLDSL